MLHARSWSSAGLDERVIPFRKQSCKQSTSADCVLKYHPSQRTSTEKSAKQYTELESFQTTFSG